jgi:alpha-glucosidase (family GH31 glycosyl hydrolase)
MIYIIINLIFLEFHMRTGGVISYVTIGGIFDLYFFLGPTPENTVQQYVSSVGRAPMPPYWGLGFQLCRYGYDSIANMKAAVDRTRQYDIPHDVQYGDIDIMRDQLDFTYDTTRFAGLPAYIKELKTEGIKFVTILVRKKV